ncbi:MAG: hypothetical protein AMJ66_05595 [Betaproteobacteria bacterium SG8_40]|nr:MAG: hypothetical protein AMJ66_05595 [Betaproteobacteria bacterium SG8_40]
MLKKTVEQGKGGKVVLMDSITKVNGDDKGAVVVCASHGGTSSGEFALEVPLKLVVFNDAGGGKDNAGIAALEMLQGRGVAAATVAHTSGRIGDSMDMWENGVLSHVKAVAGELGLSKGDKVCDKLTKLVA